MKTIFLIIFIIIFCKISYSNSLFDTEFYEINFTSNNVEADKLIKIKEIKFLSINHIFNNILIEEDYLNFQKKLNEDLINIFIKNIIIENEKIINNYYSKIKINFDKKIIINYLRKNQLSYLEYLPDKMLTIIYENYKINKILFSKYNFHYNFLKNNKNKYKFYKIPNLDVNDKYMLSYIENLNINKLNSFKKKYFDLDTIIINVEKYGKQIKYTIYILTNNKILKVSNFNFKDYNYEKLFSTQKNKIINNWKIENKIQNKTINQINCEIKYFNLKELKQIKLYLNNISIINKLKLNKISNKINNYDITYFGNKKILLDLLKLNNINILLDNDYCKIYLK